MSKVIYEIHQFNSENFVEEYWQKKPCVIRGFCKSFIDPLDEHDLAGLAMEHDIDSRVVSLEDSKWDVKQGPFTDFEQLCIGKWTLLVQGVDKYVDELSELTDIVNFIPNWRIDDVMVSFSVPDAGVGPHTDEYDVFIVQGKGKRQWKVGVPNSAAAVFPHKLLKQIEHFEPCIDEVLKTGDAIYIPPKHPHHGIALEPCLNYSIGFRAPTDNELLVGLIDELDLSASQTRYEDPNLAMLHPSNKSPSALTKDEVSALKQHISRLLLSRDVEPALLSYLSRQELQIEPLSEPLDASDISEFLSINGYQIYKLPAVRPLHLEVTDKPGTFDFYIDGNAYSIECASVTDKQYVEHFLNQSYYELDEIFSNRAEWITLLTSLINDGYWELIYPE